MYVVDSHGDALQYWEALPGSAYRVLHVDSHADMFLDFPQALGADSASREALHATLGPQVHLSNFIPLGILGGKVDGVVWLRSDFQECRYNGPPPGEYEFTVGAPDIDGGPALCYWQRGGRSFQDYSFVPDPMKGGYQVLGETSDWPPRERNLWWEKVPYLLDDFGLHLIGEPMGTPFAPPRAGLERNFVFGVVAESQLMHDREAGSRFLASKLGQGPWVLDVDLDFFATLAPALAPAVRRLGLDAPAANSLGRSSQKLAAVVQAIEEEDPGFGAFRLPLLEDALQRLLALGPTPTAAEVAAELRESDPDASEPASDLLERIASILGELGEEQREVWRRLSPEEWDSLIESPHGPHFVATREEVAQAASNLEALLRGLVELGLPPPEAVTVARSTDLYLPLELGPHIEEQMLGVLQRLGWMEGTTSPSAPPPEWPELARTAATNPPTA